MEFPAETIVVRALRTAYVPVLHWSLIHRKTMLAIGLGKRDGAAQHHRWGFRGLRDMIPQTVQVILEKTRFAAGLAILENAREETALVRVVDTSALVVDLTTPRRPSAT